MLTCFTKLFGLFLCVLTLFVSGKTFGQVVISQLYGGGDVSAGSPTYKYDYIELFNRGTNAVNLSGYSLQYGSATGAAITSRIGNLTGIIEPGHYYLIQTSQGTSGNGNSLSVTPDIVFTVIGLHQTNAKIALVSGTALLGCGGTTSCSGSDAARIVDLVGYGSSNFYEGSGAAPALANVNAALFRVNNGCTDTNNNATDFLNGIPNPRNSASSSPITASIAGNLTICAGTSTTLTASGGNNFLWDTGATIATLVTTPTSTSAYSLTVNTSGCSSTTTVTVTVNVPPTSVSLSSGILTCSRPSVILTASSVGGDSYRLSDGQSNSTGVFEVSASGTYTVVVSGANGCTAAATSTVMSDTVVMLPVSIQAQVNPICPETSTTLLAGGCIAGTIKWYLRGELTSFATGAAVTVSPVQNTSYEATCFSMDGCESPRSAPYAVTLLPAVSPVTLLTALPVAGIPNAPVTLSAVGCTAGVVFYKDATGTIEVGRTSGNMLVVTPVATTTYTAACFIGSCRGPLSNAIEVSSSPCNFTAAIGATSTVVCPGTEVILTASPGIGFLWSTGLNESQITVTTAGVYSVVVTNVQGCSATASTTIAQGMAPVPIITGETNLIEGQTTLLTAWGGSTYRWSTGAVTPTILVTTAGVYSVTLTGATGCMAVGKVEISVQPLLAAPIVAPGSSLSTCLGKNILLTAACEIGSPRFKRGSTLFNQQTYLVESPVSGTVQVDVVCVQNNIEGLVSPVTITFMASPELTVSGDRKICVSNGPANGVTLTASGATNYQWSNGMSTAAITVATAGAYSVTGTTDGCAAVTQVEVTTSVCSTEGLLVITGASINCATREVTVLTMGGNGQPIERMIQLVTHWIPASQPLLLDTEILKDPNNTTVSLYARQQGGNMAGPFTFNFRQSCPVSSTITNPGGGSTTAAGNVITVCNQSYTLTGAPLSLSTTFTCNLGDIPHEINFFPSGGVVDPNSVIEFMSIGITPWTTACTETLDLNNTDHNVFIINGRQRNTQTGAVLASIQITVTSPCTKKAGMGRRAVMENELEVAVLGNPTLGNEAIVEVKGAEGETIRLLIVDSQGRTVSELVTDKASAIERQCIGLSRSVGLYFLTVITPTRTKTVKVVRQ